MKKAFALLLTAVVLYSCSSNDDYVKDEPTPSGKLYAVAFDVKNNFKVDVDPMNRSDYYGSYFLQYIAYNEAGDVVCTNKIQEESFKDNNGNPQSMLIKDTLPAGNYHIAILRSFCGNPSFASLYYINPKNYNTDYLTPNTSPSNISNNNKEAYYKTFDISVGENKESNFTATLDPMWSLITLELKNLNNFIIPEDASRIIACLNPAPRGFYIKTGKAEPEIVKDDAFAPATATFFEIPIDEFLSSGTITEQIYSAAVDTPVSLELKFVKADFSAETIIKTEKLGSFNLIENNKNYKITVEPEENTYKLGYSISMNDFVGEDVNVTLE